MTMIHYEWIPNPSRLGNAIFRVAEELEDTHLPLAFAAQQAQADIRQRFETETDPNFVPWDEWSESYRPVAENYPNEGILRQTGYLYEQATRDNAFIVSGDTVWYDTGGLPDYAEWHQTGAVRERGGRLPARPFLGMSGEAVGAVYSNFAGWFDRALSFYPTSTGKIGRRHSLRGASGRFIPRTSPFPQRLG